MMEFPNETLETNLTRIASKTVWLGDREGENFGLILVPLTKRLEEMDGA